MVIDNIISLVLFPREGIIVSKGKIIGIPGTISNPEVGRSYDSLTQGAVAMISSPKHASPQRAINAHRGHTKKTRQHFFKPHWKRFL